MLRRTILHRCTKRFDPNTPQGYNFRLKESYHNHHEAHSALGGEMYAPTSLTTTTTTQSGADLSSSYTAATKGRIYQQHPNKARPAPPHKLPMLMNVSKACPPGYGGSALSPAKRFDGVRIVAAAFRAHEKVLLHKLNKKSEKDNNDDAAAESKHSNYLYYDDQCMVVPDAYPKSTFHFLVLPRTPPSRLMSIADVKQEASHMAMVRRMDGICAEMVKALFATPEIDVGSPKQLEQIIRIGREAEGIKVEEDEDEIDDDDNSNNNDITDYNGIPQTMLRQWLMKPRSEARVKRHLLEANSSVDSSSSSSLSSLGPPITKLKFMSGFHSLPSLCPLHMHITSLDLVSDCLKHKKHYNSFTTGFFLSRSFVENQLTQHGYVKRAVDPKSVEVCEKLETQGLACVWCTMPFKSMPELKEHLVKCSSNACYFV